MLQHRLPGCVDPRPPVVEEVSRCRQWRLTVVMSSRHPILPRPLLLGRKKAHGCVLALLKYPYPPGAVPPIMTVCWRAMLLVCALLDILGRVALLLRLGFAGIGCQSGFTDLAAAENCD